MKSPSGGKSPGGTTPVGTVTSVGSTTHVDITSPLPLRENNISIYNAQINRDKIHNDSIQKNDKLSQHSIDYTHNEHNANESSTYTRHNDTMYTNRNYDSTYINKNKSFEAIGNSRLDDSDFEGRSFLSQPLARRYIYVIIDKKLCILV